MFKNLSGFAQLLKSASTIGDRVKEIKESLARETLTGSAGGDLVQVEVSGVGEVRKLRIAPELIDRKDVELIEELVPAALNAALSEVRKLHVEKVREAMGGIELPGLSDALTNL